MMLYGNTCEEQRKHPSYAYILGHLSKVGNFNFHLALREKIRPKIAHSLKIELLLGGIDL
jgi:hypothetical protein